MMYSFFLFLQVFKSFSYVQINIFLQSFNSNIFHLNIKVIQRILSLLILQILFFFFFLVMSIITVNFVVKIISNVIDFLFETTFKTFINIFINCYD